MMGDDGSKHPLPLVVAAAESSALLPAAAGFSAQAAAAVSLGGGGASARWCSSWLPVELQVAGVGALVLR